MFVSSMTTLVVLLFLSFQMVVVIGEGSDGVVVACYVCFGVFHFVDITFPCSLFWSLGRGTCPRSFVMVPVCC